MRPTNLASKSACRKARKSPPPQPANPARPAGPAASSPPITPLPERTLQVLGAWAVLHPSESRAEFDQLLASLIAEWQPLGFSELGYIVDMASCRWRLQRLTNLPPGRIHPTERRKQKAYLFDIFRRSLKTLIDLQIGRAS